MVALSACGGTPEEPGGPATSPAAPTTSPPSPSAPSAPSAPSTPGTPGTTGAEPTEPTGSPRSTAPGESTGSPTYLPSPEPELTVPGTRLGRLERLTGIVGRGVEPGCRLLTPANGGRALLLLGQVDDQRLVDGARVTVEGYRRQNVATTCQQGEPFTVLRLIQASAGG